MSEKNRNWHGVDCSNEVSLFDYSFRLPSDTGIEVEDTEICDVNEE